MNINKKSQSVISIVFWTIAFLIIWILALGKQISYWGHQAVINGNLTGIEGFLYDNINFIVIIIILIFILAIGYMGRSQ